MFFSKRGYFLSFLCLLGIASSLFASMKPTVAFLNLGNDTPNPYLEKFLKSKLLPDVKFVDPDEEPNFLIAMSFDSSPHRVFIKHKNNLKEFAKKADHLILAFLNAGNPNEVGPTYYKNLKETDEKDSSLRKKSNIAARFFYSRWKDGRIFKNKDTQKELQKIKTFIKENKPTTSSARPRRPRRREMEPGMSGKPTAALVIIDNEPLNETAKEYVEKKLYRIVNLVPLKQNPDFLICIIFSSTGRLNETGNPRNITKQKIIDFSKKRNTGVIFIVSQIGKEATLRIGSLADSNGYSEVREANIMVPLTLSRIHDKLKVNQTEENKNSINKVEEFIKENSRKKERKRFIQPPMEQPSQKELMKKKRLEMEREGKETEQLIEQAKGKKLVPTRKGTAARFILSKGQTENTKNMLIAADKFVKDALQENLDYVRFKNKPEFLIFLGNGQIFNEKKEEIKRRFGNKPAIFVSVNDQSPNHNDFYWYDENKVLVFITTDKNNEARPSVENNSAIEAAQEFLNIYLAD